jgi:hypothetical protein
VIPFDNDRACAVAPLDGVRESVLDTRVDFEVPGPTGRERALDRGDERPYQAPSTVGRVDEHVEETRAGFAPGRPRDSEPDQ